MPFLFINKLFFSFFYIFYSAPMDDSSFTNDKYLQIYIMGHFEMFHGRWDISIIWETGHSILWEKGHLSSGNRTTYPLGIGTSSGNRDILWESGHGKRDTLSSGNRDTYPLGIGNLGDEVQPYKQTYMDTGSIQSRRVME